MSKPKFHFPSSTPALFATAYGRQLSSHREEQAQNDSDMIVTPFAERVSCRHCLRAMGLLAAVQRQREQDEADAEDLTDGDEE